LLSVALPALAHAESANLVVDGGIEQARCEADFSAAGTVPGWTVAQGAPSALCYSFAPLATPDAGAAGHGFVANGPYGDTTLTQVVDIAAAGSAIDAGGVSYTLSGWFGGWQDAPGQATLTATFLDDYSDIMPTPAQIGGVDAAARGNASALLARSATGPVPPSARRVLLQLKFTGTQSFSNAAFADNVSFTLSAPVPPAPLQAPASLVPAFDHVFIVMMENTAFQQVIGDTVNAPFINQMAAKGTLLAQYNGVYHPSDENYLAIAGGDIFVHGAIYFPDIHVASPHLGDRADQIGKTWRTYEQGMGKPCTLGPSGDPNYAPDDAPFANFTDIQDRPGVCKTHLVDQRVLYNDLASATTTPNFAWIAADDYYDGELPGNGSPKSLRVQDGYLKHTLMPLFASPAWTAQRTLLILTWDESSTYTDNHIATILVGSRGLVRQGVVSYANSNHYATGRTIEAALGLAPLTANDQYARPINEAFSAANTMATLDCAQPSVARGGGLTLNFATPVPSLAEGNTIALYPAGATLGQTAPPLSLPAAAIYGNVTFPTAGLAPGRYQAWYLYDGTSTPMAAPVAVTVTP
jgi:hypothetical protein